MMEQEEVVQEKKDDAVSVEVKAEEEKTDEESTNRFQAFTMRLFGDPNQKSHMVYGAIFFFVLGLLFSLAPRYIQTNIAWIINTSGILCLICWSICFLYVNRVQPNLRKNVELMIIMTSICAAGLYIVTEIPANKQHMTLSSQISTRGLSFYLLLIAVTCLMIRIPVYINFYDKNKSKVKAFFTAKYIAALILGILSVGTALFQFIQVVMQIFHL